MYKDGISRPVRMAQTKTEKVSYVTLEKFDNLNLLAWWHFEISSVLEFNTGGFLDVIIRSFSARQRPQRFEMLS